METKDAQWFADERNATQRCRHVNPNARHNKSKKKAPQTHTMDITTNTLQLATDAAKEAGNLLLKATGATIKINSSIDKDIKLEADELSEKLIVELLDRGLTSTF